MGTVKPEGEGSMKSVLKTTAALVAVLALTATADAAPQKARSAKASAKKQRVAAVKKAAAKTQTAQAGLAQDAQSVERAQLADVAPKAAPKKWSANLITDTYGAQMKSVNSGNLAKKDSGSSLATDFSARINYKVEDTITAGFAYEWGQEYSVGDQESNTTMYDPFVRLSKSDLANLGGGVGVSGQARLYLPFSEDSQDREQIAQIRLYAVASKELSKTLSASFTFNPRIFIQQNDKYINAKGEDADLDTFRLLSSAGLKYSVNSWLALEQTFGVYQKWKTNNARKDFLDASTSVYLTPASWLEVNLGVRQMDGATDTRKTGLKELYSADQTEYFMITTLSI